MVSAKGKPTTTIQINQITAAFFDRSAFMSDATSFKKNHEKLSASSKLSLFSFKSIFYIIDPRYNLAITPPGSERRHFIWCGKFIFLDQPIDHRLSQSDTALDLIKPDEAVRLFVGAQLLVRPRVNARSLSRKAVSIAGISSPMGSSRP